MESFFKEIMSSWRFFVVCEGQLFERLSLDCARDDQYSYSCSRSCPGANHQSVGVRLFYIN